MIYVFEGIAGVGKTTTARAFSERTGFPYFEDYGRHELLAEFDSPRDWMIRSAQHDVDLAAMSRICDFVVDRWVMSTQAYGRQRGEVLDDRRTRRIYEIAECKIFFLLAPSRVAHDRIVARDGREKRTRNELAIDLRGLIQESKFAKRSGVEVVVVDADRTREEVLDAICTDERR